MSFMIAQSTQHARIWIASIACTCRTSSRSYQTGKVLRMPRKPGAETAKALEVRQRALQMTEAQNADLHMRKWQLISAVCLERPPVVSAPLNEMERSFAALLDKQEFETSWLSDHELTKLQEAGKAKRKKKQQDAEEDVAQEDAAVKETAQDLEDKWNENFQKFAPADRTTEADQRNDVKSLNRKLDRKLYLVVNQQLGDAPQWVFPQGPWQNGESMRQTAERVLHAHCGETMKCSFLGSVPFGFCKYKYPVESDIAKEFYGAKVFFFKALLNRNSANVTPSEDIKDFKWATREELEQTVIPKYFNRIERFMYEFNYASLRVNETDHDTLFKLRY
ncbi:hypothetical protein RvY_03641 [Ramazzottius varieornatus]|uniref:Large ribosomal subunit protein mL46 n=1 Tax=Ramazzottius varieornatus TaxID=947166 RepID=A0A1D1UYX8_RAMVA|nr:hypothetical protein RvY_03641 [Ramazzottius varieornatus]